MDTMPGFFSHEVDVTESKCYEFTLPRSITADLEIGLCIIYSQDWGDEENIDL